MTSLAECRTEVQPMSPETWTDTLSTFRDANLYQTQEYGAVHWRDDRLTHMAFRDGSSVVAAAQVSFVRAPLVGGIAYVSSGPMWRPRTGEPEPDHLRRIVRVLRDEFVYRRRL